MNKYAAQSRAAQGERRKRRMCGDKEAFPTPGAARQKGQDFYRCKHCGLYHRTGQLAGTLAIVRNAAR